MRKRTWRYWIAQWRRLSFSLQEPARAGRSYEGALLDPQLEAIEQCKKDLQLYPNSPQIFTLADAYYHKGMPNEAVEAYAKAWAHRGMASERIDKAKKAFTQSGVKGFYLNWIERLKSKPQKEQDYVDIGELYAWIGEKDQAFEWLEKAYAELSGSLLRLREELSFENLRSDPRYADLQRRHRSTAVTWHFAFSSASS